MTTIDLDSLPPARPRWLTPRQCAARWQISVRKTQEYLTARQLVGTRFGRLWRIDIVEVERFEEAMRRGEIV